MNPVSKLYVKRVPSRIAKGNGHDTIMLADGMIIISVNKIEGNQVQLAVSCPRDIDIRRGEQSVRSE
jgi:sRNA-binding carbon storage regulator CsrA